MAYGWEILECVAKECLEKYKLARTGYWSALTSSWYGSLCSGSIRSPAPLSNTAPEHNFPYTLDPWLTIGGLLSRLLAVLLTELGIHQSQQRTVLSEHMPAKFRDDGGAREGKPRAPSLSRIDRPHFNPAFVELLAAGKGCTVREAAGVQK